MILSHIVAAAKNGVIGTHNALPWNIPEDMKFFRDKTKGHIMIMGRKTFESFGAKPLPNRLHIVISRQPHTSTFSNVLFVKNVSEAIEAAKVHIKDYPEEVFVIGGGEIYSQTMNLVDRIYLTRIEQDFEGDTIYPEVPLEVFAIKAQSDRTEPIAFSFLTYQKKT